ncbi:GspH/FimT family pseudopilin [Aquisalimonas sp.]|uniref:GspH/FimT family pseudopilin n=1 Tax=unclassified Aquisalimonas TaxID=2644645 RepID=UPI0025C2D0EF|nr:GspH/FimT family pseudopilin [Aquisalimonas sp.]
MHKEKGFTLIELMVTVAVMGVLLTLGIPGFQYLMQSNHMSTQTNELVTGLATARSEAVRSNQSTVLEAIDGDWDDGFRIVRDSDALRVFETFGTGLELDDGDGGTPPANITFRGDGTRGAASSTVTIGLEPADDCMGDMRREITITPGGSVSTTRSACNDD